MGPRPVRLHFHRGIEIAVAGGRSEVAATLHWEGERSSPRWVGELTLTTDQRFIYLEHTSGAISRIPWTAVLSHQTW